MPDSAMLDVMKLLAAKQGGIGQQSPMGVPPAGPPGAPPMGAQPPMGGLPPELSGGLPAPELNAKPPVEALIPLIMEMLKSGGAPVGEEATEPIDSPAEESQELSVIKPVSLPAPPNAPAAIQRRMQTKGNTPMKIKGKKTLSMNGADFKKESKSK